MFPDSATRLSIMRSRDRCEAIWRAWTCPVGGDVLSRRAAAQIDCEFRRMPLDRRASYATVRP